MSTRSDFFAFVGSIALVGPVVTNIKGISRPTLALPWGPKIVVPEPAEPSAEQFPRLAAYDSQMNAIADLKVGLPSDIFHEWLEGGLRMVEGCKPGGLIFRAIEIDRR